MKNVMILTGAGQIGMAIARRMGHGMKIVIGDKKPEHAQAISQIMNQAGFDTAAMEMDLSSRDSIKALIAQAQQKFKEMRKASNDYVDDLMRRADESLSENLAELRKTRQSIKTSQRNSQL